MKKGEQFQKIIEDEKYIYMLQSTMCYGVFLVF